MSSQGDISGYKTGIEAFTNGNGGTGSAGTAGATAGIYGNSAIEATYPFTEELDGGEPLDGSKYKYTLTFADGQYPPVDAFWSVTMYNV